MDGIDARAVLSLLTDGLGLAAAVCLGLPTWRELRRRLRQDRAKSFVASLMAPRETKRRLERSLETSALRFRSGDLLSMAAGFVLLGLAFLASLIGRFFA